MIWQINAVYENGVIKPLGPLDLTENQVVSAVISDQPAKDDRISRSKLDLDYLDRLRELAKELPPPPDAEEVRRIMAKVPGSLSDDIFRRARGSLSEWRPIISTPAP